MDPIDYDSDTFADITARDSRFAPRAYALLMDVINYLTREGDKLSAADILNEFRERSIELYGPLARTVLAEWGVKKCEDVGEMVFNLVESRRVGQDEGATTEEFAGHYTFKEAFDEPFEP